ncbi:hypothetical protein [Rathayibacter tanaceti]|uniref:Uncharacterized protein n=1 Tax=Rathayibacter tanaceti TaxID=1671680 RepID=A0A162FUW3_9MICO|nr:hypothetical protein [Rathayibacter tanaceti]KZX19840.1 hypothetical protein ACH61_03065 [Rathayibacter tanaceti]
MTGARSAGLVGIEEEGTRRGAGGGCIGGGGELRGGAQAGETRGPLEVVPDRALEPAELCLSPGEQQGERFDGVEQGVRVGGVARRHQFHRLAQGPDLALGCAAGEGRHLGPDTVQPFRVGRGRQNHLAIVRPECDTG